MPTRLAYERTASASKLVKLSVVSPERRRINPPSVGFDPLPATTPPCDRQMANAMARYMDNLANAVGVDSGTFEAVNERLSEITATLESLAKSNASFTFTIAKQSKELRSLRQKVNKTNKKGGIGGGSPSNARIVS